MYKKAHRTFEHPPLRNNCVSAVQYFCFFRWTDALRCGICAWNCFGLKAEVLCHPIHWLQFAFACLENIRDNARKCMVEARLSFRGLQHVDALQHHEQHKARYWLPWNKLCSCKLDDAVHFAQCSWPKRKVLCTTDQAYFTVWFTARCSSFRHAKHRTSRFEKVFGHWCWIIWPLCCRSEATNPRQIQNSFVNECDQISWRNCFGWFLGYL